MRPPGVDPITALAPRRRDVVAIEDDEAEPEPGFHLFLPLQQHARRRGDHDGIDPTTEQQLARDETCLYGLAEADIVGDEEVDPRKLQGLAQRLKLISVNLDASSKRRLEQRRIGRGDRRPTQRVQVGRECSRLIEPVAANSGPEIVPEDFRIQLGIPEQFETFALSIILNARQAHQRRIPRSRRRDGFLDQPMPVTCANERAR
jgi:hypothetical protein